MQIINFISLSRSSIFMIGFIYLMVFKLIAQETAEKEIFHKLNQQAWQEVFAHQNQSDWSENWFLDGQDALVSSNSEYFEINTQDRNDKNRIFAVLWTQQSFTGDLKIEYDFKKADEHNKGVNIIYIQAEGDGQKGYPKDITLWSEQRNKAAMSDYFQNMHTFHMSYAAFGNNPNIVYKDYIRGRRYLPLNNHGLKNTQMEGEYNDTQLFTDHQWVHITIIKKAKEFIVEFKHPDKTQYSHFTNKDQPALESGRIGLRLMPNRISHFKNFKVSKIAP